MKLKWFSRAAVTGLLLTMGIAAQAAPQAPRVAVTDLAYEERVSEYFRVVSASEKSSLRASGRES